MLAAIVFFLAWILYQYNQGLKPRTKMSALGQGRNITSLVGAFVICLVSEMTSIVLSANSTTPTTVCDLSPTELSRLSAHEPGATYQSGSK